MEVINDTMPKHGIEPDVFSYNTLLSGLGRVGDTEVMREFFTTMTNKQISVDKFTIEALVDGLLNAGDIGGAITLVQDVFNQHHVLPPYTSHLQIIEFALGNDLVYEAKRHVYFLQQLWNWKPVENERYTNHFRRVMYFLQINPKLSKEALTQLFAYFGEGLTEQDFLL